jgi:hypothetical protein
MVKIIDLSPCLIFDRQSKMLGDFYIYSKRLSALHDENELKRSKICELGGCPVCLPLLCFSVSPVKLAGLKDCGPGSRETQFLSSKNFQEIGFLGPYRTVWYGTILYHTPFISPPCFSLQITKDVQSQRRVACRRSADKTLTRK